MFLRHFIVKIIYFTLQCTFVNFYVLRCGGLKGEAGNNNQSLKKRTELDWLNYLSTYLRYRSRDEYTHRDATLLEHKSVDSFRQSNFE